ncbi:MAG: DUF91 domain-containing protein [Gammaproteobacteria bacterium]|nr:DUF91 domain-containing protein [Gammaproteobacteria bacterium]
MATWVFSNNAAGYYGTDDWDTSTILSRLQYYLKVNEPNRGNVTPGDRIVLREYGTGLWGTCVIAGQWQPDSESLAKHEKEAGWFPISDVDRWAVTLPYALVKEELSNQNHRLRIARATDTDFEVIRLAKRFYERLGYGSHDGTFFVLEAGLEEAVKQNLGQLGLRLADESIQQQCNLGLGIGRTDLICLDKEDNYVVLELKATYTSDAVVGQILRYMGYIRENMAAPAGKAVRGIVLTPSYDEQLRLAAKEANVTVLRVGLL